MKVSARTNIFMINKSYSGPRGQNIWILHFFGANWMNIIYRYFTELDKYSTVIRSGADPGFWGYYV
jgi:hypothetical protein